MIKPDKSSTTSLQNTNISFQTLQQKAYRTLQTNQTHLNLRLNFVETLQLVFGSFEITACSSMLVNYLVRSLQNTQCL